ncbi:hypothetical protein DTO002I6_1903 [Penicillium roqueforti]|nr:hypothetical protein DTO002I6_1903 [Penicillium roqueforti]
MLTNTSLLIKNIEVICNLEYVVNDNELRTVPPVPIPSQLTREVTSHFAYLDLSKFDREVPASAAYPHSTFTSSLLVLARDIVLSDLPEAARFLGIKIKHKWSYGPVLLDKKKHTLVGELDYGIWYGDMEDLALIAAVVRTKPGEVQKGIAQTLASMGCVHRRRKNLKKNDCTIYGLVTDDKDFWFLKISHDSNWSVHPVMARCSRDCEKVLGMLVYFFEKAVMAYPRSNKSGQLHAQESDAVGINDWDMCSIE